MVRLCSWLWSCKDYYYYYYYYYLTGLVAWYRGRLSYCKHTHEQTHTHKYIVLTHYCHSPHRFTQYSFHLACTADIQSYHQNIPSSRILKDIAIHTHSFSKKTTLNCLIFSPTHCQSPSSKNTDSFPVSLH